jgi:hypothetical protein
MTIIWNMCEYDTKRRCGCDCYESKIWCETGVHASMWKLETMLDNSYMGASSGGTIREILIFKLYVGLLL